MRVEIPIKSSAVVKALWIGFYRLRVKVEEWGIFHFVFFNKRTRESEELLFLYVNSPVFLLLLSELWSTIQARESRD